MYRWVNVFKAIRPFSAYKARTNSSYRGAYRLTLINLFFCLSVCLTVCLSVCLSVFLSVCLSAVYGVSVTFAVFNDGGSCTRPVSSNPRSMEAVEYGLTRGTCFPARRLEVIAVAWLLWISCQCRISR